MFALLMLMGSLTARAQDAYNAHGFNLVPGDGDPLDPLALWRPEVQVKRSFGVMGLFEYADTPLATYRWEGDELVRTPLVDDLVGLNLGGAYALSPRVALTAALPIWIRAEDSGGQSVSALGDLRFAVPITLIGPGLREAPSAPVAPSEPPADPSAPAAEAPAPPTPPRERGLTVSVVPFVNLPSGDEAIYLGSGGFGGGAVGAVGYAFGPVQVFGDLGGEWTPPAELVNLQGGPFVKGGVGASAYVLRGVALRGEVVMSASALPNALAWSESPAEALLSLHGRYRHGLGWTLGGATALNSGAGAAVFRLFAGLSWTMGKAPAAAVAPATASLDVLVRDPAGQPIPLAEVSVAEKVLSTDTDGVAHLADLHPGRLDDLVVKAPRYAPSEVEPFRVQPGANERLVVMQPLPATLKVVALNRADNQPLNARVRFLAGPADHALVQVGEDGEEAMDLQPGSWRVLVGADGFRAQEMAADLEIGEFETLVVRLDATAVDPCKGAVVLHSVHFDFNVATPQPGALPALQDMAVALKDCPEVVVEVGGHTDSKGSDLYNLDLSQRRMESVKGILVGYGVPAERLVAKGYGETKPIASNKSEKGRAQNRRVEFAPIRGDAVVVPAPTTPTTTAPSGK